MEWSIFALVQMFIITLGVSLAFWLRLRGVQKQNDLIREHFDAQQAAADATPADSPQDWLQTQLAQWPQDAASAAVAEQIVNQILNPADGFEDSFQQVLGTPGDGVASTEHAELIAQLEADLAAAQAQADAAVSGDEGDRTEELKTLLQQFTKDSREMMACIQTLETENAQLKAQLGEASADSETADNETGVSETGESEARESVAGNDTAEDAA